MFFISYTNLLWCIKIKINVTWKSNSGHSVSGPVVWTQQMWEPPPFIRSLTTLLNLGVLNSIIQGLVYNGPLSAQQCIQMVLNGVSFFTAAGTAASAKCMTLTSYQANTQFILSMNESLALCLVDHSPRIFMSSSYCIISGLDLTFWTYKKDWICAYLNKYIYLQIV